MNGNRHQSARMLMQVRADTKMDSVAVQVYGLEYAETNSYISLLSYLISNFK